MIRRFLVTVWLVLAVMPAWVPGASTQEVTTSSDATVDEVAVSPAVAQQAQIQRAQLVEHHGNVMELRDRVQEAALEHQEMQASQLGDRAPTETTPPMATIAPLENE